MGGGGVKDRTGCREQEGGEGRGWWYLDFKLVLPFSQMLVGFKILSFMIDNTANHYESFLSLNTIPLSLYLGPYLLGEEGVWRGRTHESFMPELNLKEHAWIWKGLGVPTGHLCPLPPSFSFDHDLTV